MKRLAKILSASLLLALLVSIFAVFAAFADETESVTPGSNDEEAKLIYSLDDRVGDRDYITAATSQIAIRKDKGHFSNGKYSMYPVLVFETATNDVRYYNLGYVGWDVNEAYTKQPFLNQYIGGNYAGDKKDSDYLILDFDYAVSGALPNYLNIQARFGWEGQGSEDDPKSGVSIRVYGDPDDNSLKMKTVIGNTEVTHDPVIPGFTNGWAHITVIMDFSDSTDTIGGAPIYVYINGVRTVDSAQATIRNFDENLICGDNWRLFVSNGTKNDDGTYTPNGKDESVSIANYTVKTLPAGYNGTLTQLIGIGAMASGSAVTLDNYPELAYCLMNNPAAVKVADIEREGVEDPIPVYSVDHLDANLLPGDVVTLYKNIETRHILVPANEAGEPSVTFVDNGFSVAHLLPVEYKDGGYIYDWIIRNPSTGASRSVADVQTESDTLGAKFSSLKTASYITLLNDVAVAPTKGFTWNKNTGTIVFDLNQHSFTTDQAGSYQTATPLKIVYKDGTVNNSPSSTANCFVYTNGAGAFFVFDGMTFNNVSRNDLRSSCNIIINNSVVNGKTSSKNKDAIFEARTTSTSFLTKTFINVRCSTVNATYGTFVNVSNVATKSTKLGSVNAGINFVGSKVEQIGSKCVVNISYEACQAVDNTNANQNNVSVNFFNTNIESASSVVYAKLELLTKPITGGTADATGLYAGTKVKVYNSDITTAGNVFRSDGTTQTGFLDPENSVYTHEALVELANSSIEVGAARGIIGRATETLTNAAVIYGEGVKLSNDKLVDDGNSAEVITTVYSDGVKIAQQKNDTYPFIATSDYKDVKYYNGYGSTEVVDLGVWASADAPVIEELIPLPENTATTAYRYAVDENGVTKIEFIPAFPLKANLTLSESISINVFIPTSVGSVEVVGLTIDGEAYNGKADVVELADGNKYFKVVVSGITPTKAMEMYEIGFTVADMNGVEKTFSKSISVVDYLDNVYKNGDDSDKTLVEKIFTYVVLAADYAENSVTITAPEGSNLVAGTPAGKEYVALEENLDLKLALNLEDGYRWVIEDLGAGEAVVVKYNVNGTLTEKTLTADASGAITFSVKACDLLDAVTVDGKTFTFENYAAAVFKSENSDDKTKTLINAIYDYAYAVDSYNN